MISTRYQWVVGALVGALLAVSGCSNPEPDNAFSPTTRAPDIGEIPGFATTTAPGGRTDTDFQALGLSPSQSSCLLRSDIDRSVDVTLSAEPDGVIDVVVAEDVIVTLPKGLRTGEQVWGSLLAFFAGSCLSSDEVPVVARVLGSADDDLAIADDLPGLIEARRGAGFDSDELACVDAVLRDAPARISSLAADPRVGDARCVETGRLDVLRQGSLRNRLVLVGATSDEAQCLATTPEAVAALDEAAAILAAGSDRERNDGALDASATCLSPDRLASLALLVTVNDVSLTTDFG